MTKRKIVVIIQARMGSTRLPGKVLKKLMDKTVLSHVIDRCKQIKLVDQVVVATSNKADDIQIIREAEWNNVECFAGSEEDVLQRYYLAAQKYEADVVVRITSDCPLLDPTICSQIIAQFFQINNIDYCSNALVRSFPRGLDVEVISFNALEQAYDNANKQHQREHVTPYIYENPQIFTISNFVNSRDYSHLRWTLDTLDDWILIEKIYQELYGTSDFNSWKNVLDLFHQNPHLALINAHVEQKKI